MARCRTGLGEIALGLPDRQSAFMDDCPMACGMLLEPDARQRNSGLPAPGQTRARISQADLPDRHQRFPKGPCDYAVQMRASRWFGELLAVVDDCEQTDARCVLEGQRDEYLELLPAGPHLAGRR